MEANSTSTINPENMYNNLNGLFTNPVFFVGLIIVVIIFLILGKNKSENPSMGGESENPSFKYLGIIVFIILLGLFITYFDNIKYFFSTDVSAVLDNILTTNPELSINVDTSANETPIMPSSNIPEITTDEQVFNIPGNYYNYTDAQTLCQAYGSRLANYQEVEDSYNSGGEWCNYGWSDGQMALFPTQTDTYNTLQSETGHEHDCGRPGINGGYIANPNVKFGVNCFGYKPKITSEEEEMMQNTALYPQSEQDILMEKKVDFWKNQLSKIIVSPFNSNTWSKV